MPRGISWLFFTNTDNKKKYVQGVTSRILLEERHSWLSWCSMCTFQCWNNPNETIFDQYIKKQHFKWLYEVKGRPLVGFLWKFPQNYIIMTTESLNSSFPEESKYISVISPPGFINQEN